MFRAFYVGDLERMMADTFPHLPHLGFLLYVGTNVAVWSLVQGLYRLGGGGRWVSLTPL